MTNNVYKVFKDNGEPGYSHLSIRINDTSDEFLNNVVAMKKDFARRSQSMKEMQKTCEKKKDFEFAKFFGQEAKYYHALYKACTYIISDIASGLYKDCPELGLKDVPLESEEFISMVISSAEMGGKI